VVGGVAVLDAAIVRELNRLFGLGRGSVHQTPAELAAIDLGDYHAVPLRSKRTLDAEGWHMQHCVGRFVEVCAQGRYRAFSIRDALGRRVATIGLRFQAGRWRVHQCQGFRNANVIEDVIVWDDADGKVDTMTEWADLHYVGEDLARIANSEMSDLLAEEAEFPRRHQI
jgi:hypothetical protein